MHRQRYLGGNQDGSKNREATILNQNNPGYDLVMGRTTQSVWQGLGPPTPG